MRGLRSPPRGLRALSAGVLTARATTRPSVSSEASDCTPMRLLAVAVRGIVSVGLNGVALVSDTYR
jgi:hypothetical protein